MDLTALHYGSLLAVGSFAFWFVLVVGFLLMTWATEGERGFGAFLILLLTISAFQIFGDADIVAYVFGNPVHMLVWIFVYFVSGTVWSVAKWWLWCKDLRHRYEDEKLKFLVGKGISGTRVIPKELRQEWLNVISTSGLWYRTLGKKPEVLENKSRILNWMTYWPCSFVFTIFNDPIRKAFRHIYYWLNGLYQSIADSAWHGVVDDLEK